MNRKTKATLVSIVVNIFLALLKYLLAILTGSLALLADAYHSASDIVVSILVFIGIKVSDREKISSVLGIAIENGVAIIISLFIFFAAYTIFKEVFTKGIITIKFLPLAIIWTIVSIVVCYLLSSYKINIGKATNSPSLIADGHHSRTDMYSSIVVLVALVGYMIGLRLDAPAAIVIALFIVSVGVEIFWSSIKTISSKTPFKFSPLTLRRFSSLEFLRAKLLHVLSKHKRAVLKITPFGIVIIYLSTGFYIVGPGEEAIVQRFGSLVRNKILPGIHYAVPRPFERVTILSTGEIRRIEIGFRTRKEVIEEPDAYLWQVTHEIGKYEKRYDEALMVTGDMNIVDADLVIQYQIEKPKEYLFKSELPEELVRSMGESAVRKIVASENIENLLTQKRADIENTIKTTLENYLKKYEMGVRILRVAIHEIHPPLDVVPAFRSVINAREDLERFIHEAEAEYNEKVPEAQADAIQMIEESRAYLIEKPNYALGKGQRFTDQYKIFRRSPEVNKTRLYLETVEDVLQDVDKYIIISPTRGSILDLRTMFKQSKE